MDDAARPAKARALSRPGLQYCAPRIPVNRALQALVRWASDQGFACGARRSNARLRTLNSMALPRSGFSLRKLMSESVVVHDGIDESKRRWVTATCGMGAVAGVATAVPFVSTFAPSERAKAAGAAVEVDIGDIKVGEKKTVEWRGQPVWIVRRSPEMIATLSKDTAELADPDSKRNPDEQTPPYARNAHRSIKEDLLVVVGICTHLGCSPGDKFTAGAQP